MKETVDSVAVYYWYLNDHLGTPQKMIDISGQVVWSAEYDAFGGAVVGVGLVENNLRFPGQYYDGETGLHYNWWRYYDVEVGRYMRVDPIGLRGGINLYGYTDGNPVNRIDPRGQATYKSAEGHFVIGGGLLEINCCTESGQGLKHLYIKVCLGAAIEASGGVGVVSNSDGKSCSNPPKNILGGELGGSFMGAGGETSVTVDTGGSGIAVSGGGDVGIGPGPIGFKATACYYRLINTMPSDSCCETGK